jgi:hypothetical protein
VLGFGIRLVSTRARSRRREPQAAHGPAENHRHLLVRTDALVPLQASPLPACDARIHKDQCFRRSPNGLGVTRMSAPTEATAIGLYAVLSCADGRRAHEIGLRMALEGRRDPVVAPILKRGLRRASSGLTNGLAAARLLTRQIANLLCQVPLFDPVSCNGVPAMMRVIAPSATTVPAMRGFPVDSIKMLRDKHPQSVRERTERTSLYCVTKTPAAVGPGHSRDPSSQGTAGPSGRKCCPPFCFPPVW